MTQVQKRKTVEVDLVDNRKMDLRNIESFPQIQKMRTQERIKNLKEGKMDRKMKEKVVDTSEVQSV